MKLFRKSETSMEYKYTLTQSAKNDFAQIINYIAVELDNKAAASQFADKLQNCIEEACLFPESGSIVANEFVPDLGIRKKIAGNYIMYYLPNAGNKTVSILRIIYGRRNIDEILKYIEV